jgi:WXG100 family type VII secretion target
MKLMADQSIRVQPRELLNESSNIKNEKGKFDSSYSDIHSQAKSLTNTTWGGEDAEKFMAQVDLFKKDFDEMSEILKQYSQFLDKSAHAYETAQQDVLTKAGNLATKIK